MDHQFRSHESHMKALIGKFGRRYDFVLNDDNSRKYTMSTLLSYLDDIDFSRISRKSLTELARFLGFFCYAAGSTEASFGSKDGKKLVLYTKALVPGSLNDETPPKQDSFHWLWRDVNLLGKDKETLITFKAINLGRLATGTSQTRWVVLLSESKDIWTLQASRGNASQHPVPREDADFESESESETEDENSDSSPLFRYFTKRCFAFSRLFPSIAVKLGTLEDLKKATEMKSSFVKEPYSTIEVVCSWTSALVDISQITHAPTTYANASQTEMGPVIGKGKPDSSMTEG